MLVIIGAGCPNLPHYLHEISNFYVEKIFLFQNNGKFTYHFPKQSSSKYPVIFISS